MSEPRNSNSFTHCVGIAVCSLLANEHNTMCISLTYTRQRANSQGESKLKLIKENYEYYRKTGHDFCSGVPSIDGASCCCCCLLFRFLHLVYSVAAADAQNYSYFTFSKPDTVILHRMADMIQVSCGGRVRGRVCCGGRVCGERVCCGRLW